jgi:tRNA threonylcarbamoyladenosine biosynthesis protein TsaE
MVTSISHSPDDTMRLGEQWGQTAQTGLVIGLCGDLGAGKTQLVRGLARGLGITNRVHSPTFALVNVYSGGRLTLFHLDLYRLDTMEQILAAGLEEFLRPDGVAVIEWAERWFDKVQSPKSKVQGRQSTVHSPQSKVHTVEMARYVRQFRWVEIEVVSETERRISYEDIGG